MRGTQALGRYGEELAVGILTAAGMVIVERNWRCEFGEIDIVARDGTTLVVCEVKTRTSTAYGAPIGAVTPPKAARLRRLAARWHAEHPMHPAQIRIDVVGILRPATGQTIVEHLRGVA
jgi:putative endonuclease